MILQEICMVTRKWAVRPRPSLTASAEQGVMECCCQPTIWSNYNENLQSLLGELTALPRVLWLMRRRAVMLLLMTTMTLVAYGIVSWWKWLTTLYSCCIFQTAGWQLNEYFYDVRNKQPTVKTNVMTIGLTLLDGHFLFSVVNLPI